MSYSRKTELYHKGTKGSKWGYTKGKRNGNRTALDDLADMIENGKTEMSRNIDNAKYELADEVADTKYFVNEIRSNTKYERSKGSTLDKAARIYDYSKHNVSKFMSHLANATLKELNKMGNGKADNAITDTIDKGKKFLKNLFG